MRQLLITLLILASACAADGTPHGDLGEVDGKSSESLASLHIDEACELVPSLYEGWTDTLLERLDEATVVDDSESLARLFDGEHEAALRESEWVSFSGATTSELSVTARLTDSRQETRSLTVNDQFWNLVPKGDRYDRVLDFDSIPDAVAQLCSESNFPPCMLGDERLAAAIQDGIEQSRADKALEWLDTRRPLECSNGQVEAHFGGSVSDTSGDFGDLIAGIDAFTSETRFDRCQDLYAYETTLTFDWSGGQMSVVMDGEGQVVSLFIFELCPALPGGIEI